MERAYSLLEIKAVREEERVIEGIASTPEADRMGDVVEPMGAQFKLPMPLLWQHFHDEPVGWVEFAKPTKDGIPFKARFAPTKDLPEGNLKTRLEDAWHSVRMKLVRAVSIGFRALEYSFMDGGGIRFTQWEWLELSAVTIPANASATITTIKSIDRKLLAASGQSGEGGRGDTPGVSGQRNSGQGTTAMKPIAEQIAEIQARRKVVAEEMKGFGDVAELDETQAAEFGTLAEELDTEDKKLNRLQAMERALGTATPARGAEPDDARKSRLVIPAEAKSVELPKGTRFARYAMAIAAGKGSISDTLAYAKRWDTQTPEVTAFIKATVGTAADVSPGWGSELAQPTNLASEFIDLLRPATIMGRIEGFRRVPFNVLIPAQSAGASVNWVGEAAAKPVSNPDFTDVTLGYNKIAGIVVMSEELVRLSSPSAEETVRRDLVEQVAAFMDQQFVDPTVTATSSRPASVTNAVVPVPASGTDAEAFTFDMNAALASLSTNINLATLVIVMNDTLARGLASLRNALGQKEFPEMTARGGSIDGFPVLVSNSSPAGYVVFIVAGEILLADDGVVRLDSSNQATLDIAGGDEATLSLWQKNLIALRAERWVTYKKRRASPVAMISGAAYGPTGDTSP